MTRPKLKTALFGVLAALIGLTLILGVGELIIRKNQPEYNFQVFRESSKLTIQETEHGLSWIPHENRVWGGCEGKSGTLTLLLEGSSILYSSTTSSEEGFSVELRNQLKDHGQKNPCIINQAVPGFTFANQHAVINGLDKAIEADYLIWEIWANSPNTFVKVGTSVFNFGSDDAGFVPDPFGLKSLNTVLMGTSRLYEWMALSNYKKPYSRSHRDKWAEFSADALNKMTQAAENRKAKLILVFFPNARQPFAEQREREKSSYGKLAKAAQEKGIPTLFLSEKLNEEQRKDYFADQCCHYTASGVKEVSKIIIDSVIDTSVQ